jgi:hypothetical protein
MKRHIKVPKLRKVLPVSTITARVEQQTSGCIRKTSSPYQTLFVTSNLTLLLLHSRKARSNIDLSNAVQPDLDS